MAIPYAPSRQYVPDNSIIDIIMQAARQKADSQREGGAIWGNTVGNLGKIASGTIRDIAEGKAIAQEQERKAILEAPRLADEAKLRGLNIQRGERELADADKEAQRTAWFESKLQSGEMPKPAEVMAMMGEKRGFDVIKGIGLLQPEGAARYSDQAKVLRDAARAVKALPAAAQPAAWGVMRSSLMSQGAVDESMVPEAFDPNLLEQAAAFGQEPAKPMDPRVVGRSLVSPEGKVIYRDPESPKGDAEPLVPVIGDDGQPVLMRRSQAEGRRPASNREQGRPVLSGDANRLADSDSSLAEAQKLTDTMKTGNAAWLGTKIPDVVTEYTGWGSNAKVQEGVINKVKQIIGKAMEGGVLRKEDEIKYAKIIPKIEDPPDVANGKIQGLIQSLTEKRGFLIDSLDDAGYDVSKFRDRSKKPVSVPDGTKPGPGASRSAGPKMGEQRTINGQRAIWDGKGWLPA